MSEVRIRFQPLQKILGGHRGGVFILRVTLGSSLRIHSIHITMLICFELQPLLRTLCEDTNSKGVEHLPQFDSFSPSHTFLWQSHSFVLCL